tara:strand:- start:51 stop:299 length:249 start_codon:yes stop_codon:yes gene_type:complete
MPTVIDKATGEVIEEFSYDDAGQQLAQDMVNANPSLTISNNAQYRSNTSYEDGSNIQNVSENVDDPYGAYNPMADLTKNKSV